MWSYPLSGKSNRTRHVQTSAMDGGVARYPIPSLQDLLQTCTYGWPVRIPPPHSKVLKAWWVNYNHDIHVHNNCCEWQVFSFSNKIVNTGKWIWFFFICIYRINIFHHLHNIEYENGQRRHFTSIRSFMFWTVQLAFILFNACPTWNVNKTLVKRTP